MLSPFALESVRLQRVQLFNEARGFGFVRNELLQQACSQDAFFLRGDLPSCEVGATLTFRVAFDEAGRPRVVPPPLTLEQCRSVAHRGTIVDFDPARGRGFIRKRSAMQL